MGSTSYLTKSKSAGSGYRAKSGSSAGSDKEMNGKLRRAKIRRPVKMNEYGVKRIPDYTELAYKEAVSKLRYFLSGNYTPSIRSYGGSASIKNLDESEPDLDKKYGYHAVSEYKPRPRLTAKYTTLYADSLKNYDPPKTVLPPTSTPASADLSGATNPDVMNFIQKQEEYIEQLERESQYCRDELNNLLGKVKEVISENENLHEAQKNKLITRMFHTYNAGSETDELDDIGDSTGLDSDNKISPSKRKSPKYRSSSIKLEGPNIVFESRIAELEAQLTQSKIDLKKIQDENNESKRKLASGLVDSTCLDGFKRQIDNLQRDKTSLEGQVSKLKLSLENKDVDLESRYRRGSDTVEHQLREERNNLESELRRLKDDLSKERSKVRELTGEGARRAIHERSAAEQRYNVHIDELQHDLAAQYDNVAKLQLDLERQRRDDNDLKRELSMKSAAVEELKMELKNKSSSLQADLAQAYAEKASLEEELASARLALERHQRQAKHETNRLNSEIQSLRQRLDRADADLVHSRRENLRLSEQISNLEKEINMKSLTPATPEKTKKERELNSVLESMENKHTQTVAELESMIQSQNSLMEKLTGECRLLTDKLDDANRRHKQELATLQRQVEILGQTMQTTHTPPSIYQAPSTFTTSANRNDAHITPEPGPIYPRTDSTGHTQNEPVPDVRQNRVSRDMHQPPRVMSKQASRSSLIHQDDNRSTPIKKPVQEPIRNYKDEMETQETIEPKLTNYEEKVVAEKPLEDEIEYERDFNQSNFEQPIYDNDKAGVSYEQGHEGDYEQSNVTDQNYDQSYVADPEPKYEQDHVEPDQTYDPNFPSQHFDESSTQQQPQQVYEEVHDQNYGQVLPNDQLYEQPVNYDQSVVDPNYDQSQTVDPSYDQSQTVDPNYDQSQTIDPNYDQSQIVDPNYDAQDVAYENQEYQQNYEQPAYAQDQYENYEQYPQQYVDPNASQDQFKNYPEESYQTEETNPVLHPTSPSYPQVPQVEPPKPVPKPQTQTPVQKDLPKKTERPMSKKPTNSPKTKPVKS